MILVVAGTQDGRELAAHFSEAGMATLLSTWSDYGGDLAQVAKCSVRSGALDQAGFEELLREKSITLVFDATHPYAVQVTRQLMAACTQCKVPYIRYERPRAPLTGMQVVHAANFAEAAELAARFGNTVFLTIGSRHLKNFKESPLLQGKRIVARVLPDAAVLQHCQDIGFKPKDIVAVQGPFSQNLNVALLHEYGATVLVTKESGTVGGTEEKLAAAQSVGIPVILIQRPALKYPVVVSSVEEAMTYIRRNNNGIYYRSDED